MNLLTTLIILALIATIGTLGMGIGSMMRGGDFDQKHSTQLMFARVGIQGVAVLLLFGALLASNA